MKLSNTSYGAVQAAFGRVRAKLAYAGLTLEARAKVFEAMEHTLKSLESEVVTKPKIDAGIQMAPDKYLEDRL